MKKYTLLSLVLLPFISFGQNLAPNPTLNGTTDWSDNNAGSSQAYDSGFTRTTDGSGSWLINSNGTFNSGIRSSNISGISAGDYILRYYVYGTAGDRTRPIIRDNGINTNLQGDIYVIQADNTWELVESTFTLSGAGPVSLRAQVNSNDPLMDFYVDDFSFEFLPVASEKHIYDFSIDDTTGFSSSNGLVTHSGTTLDFNADGTTDRPGFVQNLYPVNANEKTVLFVQIDANASTADEFQFSFRDPTDGNFKFYGWTSINSGSTTYYIQDLTNKPEWTGEITEWQIRTQINAGGNPDAGTVSISKIGFYAPNDENESIIDGNWSDSATWILGVPTASQDVLINSIVTINDNDEANNVAINSGAQILVNKGNSLTVNGDLMTDLSTNNSLVLRGDSDQFSSLIVNGTSTGDVRFRRYVNSVSNGNDLIAPPVSMPSFNNFYSDNDSFFVEDPNSNAVLFGPFNNASNPGVYENWDFNATAPLVPGKGYRMGTNGTLDVNSALNFHGTVVTSDVSISITSEVGNYGKWNLIGNPYTSYITLADFLTANDSEFDVATSGIYGYDGNASDGWIVWNQSYSDANPNTLITPGQGFFVASKSGGGTVNFTRSMQVIGDSDDFILGRNSQSAHIGKVTLKLFNDSSSHATDIYFNHNATSGLDTGYDAAHFGGFVPEFGVYTTLADGSYDYPLIIQTLGQDEVSGVIIPVGVNALQGEQITFSLFNLDLPVGTTIYLEDVEENSFTQLNDTDYIVTPNTDINGIGRFYLHVGDSTLSIKNDFLKDLMIFTENQSIIVKGQISNNTKLRLIDIQGRLVKEFNLDASLTQQELRVVDTTGGVYIAKIQNNEGLSISKKIIIK